MFPLSCHAPGRRPNVARTPVRARGCIKRSSRAAKHAPSTYCKATSHVVCFRRLRVGVTGPSNSAHDWTTCSLVLDGHAGPCLSEAGSVYKTHLAGREICPIIARSHHLLAESARAHRRSLQQSCGGSPHIPHCNWRIPLRSCLSLCISAWASPCQDGMKSMSRKSTRDAKLRNSRVVSTSRGRWEGPASPPTLSHGGRTRTHHAAPPRAHERELVYRIGLHSPGPESSGRHARTPDAVDCTPASRGVMLQHR